ncbi:MAG: hypothetical protein IT349_06160, partial [Candidatus Eisenbacteria bacterium]|nr:hypothetical protein [Candidatus Eisenbacteria bacterium]
MKTLAITNELTLGATPPVETLEPVVELHPQPRPRPRLEVLLSPEIDHPGGAHRAPEHRLAPSRGTAGRAPGHVEPSIVTAVGAVHRAEHLEVLVRALENVGRGSRIEVLPLETRRFHPIAGRVQGTVASADPGGSTAPEPDSGRRSLIGWVRRSLGSWRGTRDAQPGGEHEHAPDASRTDESSHRRGTHTQGEVDGSGASPAWGD